MTRARGPHIATILCSAIALAAIGGPARAQDAGPSQLTVDTAIAAYEAACSAIESFDLTITTSSAVLLKKPVGPAKARDEHEKAKDSPRVEWTAVDPGERGWNMVLVSRQYYAGGKFRNDLVKQNEKDVPDKADTQVWDGAVDRRLNFAQRTGRVAGASFNMPAFFGIAYLHLFRHFDGDYTYAKFIRDRMSSARVESEGGLIILSARSTPDNLFRGNPFGVRLFLDPSRGFMPARIDLTHGYGDDPVPQSRYTNELAEVAPGLWAPVRSRVSVFVREKWSKHYGQEMGFMEVEVDRPRARFNVDLDASAFELKFPAGVMVHDEIRNTSYRAGAEKLDSYLDQLATQGRLSVDQLRANRPPLRAPSVVSWDPVKRLLVWVNLALVATVAVFVLRRQRRVEVK